MDRLDYQKQIEEERMQFILKILVRANKGMSTNQDAVALAAELGLKNEFLKEIGHDIHR